MSAEYPILVKDFAVPGDALRVACTDCDHTWKADDVDDYISWIDFRDCPHCGSFALVPMYEEAPACNNCGKLGYWESVLEYCCSRACMLQAEYAKKLRIKKIRG